MTSRRQTLQSMAGLLLAGSLPRIARSAPATGRVLVVGGGFAGATAAATLKRIQPDLQVTLVEAKATYTACPFSNLVLVGERRLADQQFGYGFLAAKGVQVRIDRAVAVDANKWEVRLAGGARLGYDRLILAPGIDLRFDAIEGYDQAAAELMPHAWQAGPQTLLLQRQLQAMPDGGLVVMVIPANPYRCPPGPYERASLMAHWLQRHKPRSKLLLLDGKDQFSKQPLFEQAWAAYGKDRLEWQGLASGARVRRVDAIKGIVETDFDRFEAAVTNVIPPQQAGAIATVAGVTDASGWCPIDPVSFESSQVPGIHVLGDSAIANAMPKSAFAANAQAKVCAVQVALLLADEAPVATTLANTCYSFTSPDQAISVAGVYHPGNGALEEVEGAGGVSPMAPQPNQRELEARYARAWFQTITSEAFG